MQTVLTRHLKVKHKDVAEVKQALSLPAGEQNRAFDDIKKLGIYSINMQKMKAGDDNLVRERRQSNDM